MSKYTTEENQELIENIKGKRFYRIYISGYGGESAYIPLNKEQYTFWKAHIDEHGDSDVVNYMTCAEDGDFDFENIDSIPDEAQFMYDEDGDPRPWYEHHKELEHQWGVDYNNAYLNIDEVKDDDYSAEVVKEVVANKDISEYISNIEEENDYNVTLTEMGVSNYETWDTDYVLQFWSAEKGSFWDGTIETVGDFDPKKLKIYTEEYANGDDVITTIEYDGVEIDNAGGDTNGKGYSVSVWSTE